MAQSENEERRPDIFFGLQARHSPPNIEKSDRRVTQAARACPTFSQGRPPRDFGYIAFSSSTYGNGFPPSRPRRKNSMGGVIPLSDATRKPRNFPVVTVVIIAINVVVFLLELGGGDAFVNKWSVVPAQITSGHGLITILTAMFMHGSWSHILGNMVFFWAFGPEIEDAMNPFRYSIFYLLGGLVAMGAQIVIDPHSTVPNLGASGAIAAVMGAFLITYPRDRIKSVVLIGIFVQITMIPAAVLIGIWFLIQLVSYGVVAHTQTGGVAYMAHIGGILFGVLTARLFEDADRIAAQKVLNDFSE
jgi:membrane associated rhomboid family serine protease